MSRPHLVIEAGAPERGYLRDTWALRHLIWMFAWREIVLRYRQTVAGVTWVVLRPLLTVVVFALVFGRFLRVPSEGVPYPLLILSGFIPWQFAAYSFSGSGESLFTHASIISKVYFPRIITPTSVFVVNLVDLAVSLVLLAALMALYRIVPDLRILALPASILFLLPGTAGLGLLFAAVSAKYRDFRNIIPFVVMLSLYLSPVAFSASVVPDAWKLWYWLNPLVGGIELFRWSAFAGKAQIYLPGMAISLAASLALLLVGYRQFRRMERSIVDLI